MPIVVVGLFFAVIDVCPAAGKRLVRAEDEIRLGEAFRVLQFFADAESPDNRIVHRVEQIAYAQDLNKLAGRMVFQEHDENLLCDLTWNYELPFNLSMAAGGQFTTNSRRLELILPPPDFVPAT